MTQSATHEESISEQERFEELKRKVREQLVATHGPIAQALRGVKHRVAIFSGKGGVGKTVSTINLGSALQQMGYRVGIFDADIHGPAVPKSLGVLGRMETVSEHIGHHDLRFDPVLSRYGLKVVSVASIWPGEEVPIMWKGAHKMRSIRYFLSAVNWGVLDFLLVDLPPGTGDEVQTVMSSIPNLGGMIVITTPQGISAMVCSKAISAARELNAPVLGLIENMSVLVCPCCGARIQLFGQSRGEQLARMMEVPFWGNIPLATEMGECVDEGIPVVVKYPDAPVSQAFHQMAAKLLASLRVERPMSDAEAEMLAHRPRDHHEHEHHHV